MCFSLGTNLASYLMILDALVMKFHSLRNAYWFFQSGSASVSRVGFRPCPGICAGDYLSDYIGVIYIKSELMGVETHE